MLSPRLTAAIAHSRALPLRHSLKRTMASGVRRSARSTRIVVCADFDQTITTRDTISLLFDAATAKQAVASDRVAHERKVQRLVDQYADEYAQLMVSALKESVAPRDFDETGLLAFLEAFAKVDRLSIQRVIESQSLAGLEHHDLQKIGNHVELKDKSIETLELAMSAIVISSNWSQTMILERLRRSGLHNVKVIANELTVDGNGITTGDIHCVVQSPLDKAKILTQQNASDEALVVFMGDSTNDLLAMLHADVGITLSFATESTFARVCRQYGIQLAALSSFDDLTACRDHAQTESSKHHRVLFTANSWDEIHSKLATAGAIE